MDKTSFAAKLAEIAGSANVRVDEPMREHTSFKVGGPADILVTPGSTASLAGVYKQCRLEGVPLFIIGNGTNLIVRDKGIRGVVIKLLDKFSGVKVEGTKIIAEAGILLSKLSYTALDNGLSGLEFAEGIPGTLGGAVTMNAGAYTGEMSFVVKRTEILAENGDIKVLEGEQHRFGKRSSAIQTDGGIVLRSELELYYGDKSDISARMNDLKRQRKDKQPLELPSAGSIFKRPEGHFTGKLVEDCGLKGVRIGGAEVSCKHCGFIVNAGNATAQDITGLIRHIQQTVRERFGVELQTEVKVVGEE